jgi:RNA polymerase sigma-54 factor
VNPLFRQAIREAATEKKEEWKGDLDRASLFVKCLQQRNNTMKRLMHKVVCLQQDFILNGETHLKPLTRVELSDELGVHESTISRAVASKSVQLPNGRIIPLSRFFSRNLNIRSILKIIIEKENKPLSDSELMKLLANQGIVISRRTVAKYRAMEGILPAHLRHHYSGIST